MVHAAHVGWFLIWSRPTVAKKCLFITMVTENPAVYLEAKPPSKSIQQLLFEQCLWAVSNHYIELWRHWQIF